MKRDKNLKQKRAEFVKEYVNKHANTTTAIIELSEKLFVSERTIYMDLTATTDKGR
jgi:DeoR/GlpR family transcriptional regulator of sugar metabolism